MKYTKILPLLVIFSSFVFFKSYSQNEKFNILIQSNRYDSRFSKLDIFEEYQYLGQYFIDRDNKSIINYKTIKEKLDEFYPNKYDSGFLSINLENEIYWNLKTPVFTDKSAESMKKFIKLIEFVKDYRPNIKVGIYALPFGFMKYRYHSLVNNYDVLMPILEKVDYISPSLYLNFNLEEKSKQYTVEYIEGILKYALQFGEELSKPVYPYVWYLINTSNKKVGGEILSFELMKLYLNTIKHYQYNNQSVSGVIWWESSDNGRKRIIKNNPHNKLLQKEDSIDKFLYEFSKTINE